MIEGVCGVVAARGAGGWILVPSIVAIGSRLRRLGARFAALTARCSAAAMRGAAARRRPQLPPMSRRVAWLLRNAPEAEHFREKLHHVLRQPKTAALVAAKPHVRRSLRQLCRMLGVEPPPELFARRPRSGPALRPAASGPRSAPSAGPAADGRGSLRSRDTARS